MTETRKGGIAFLLCSLFFCSFPNPTFSYFNVDSGLSVSGTFTDNLFFTGSDRKSDFGTFLSPIVAANYESRNFIFNGIYRGTAQFFINNPGGNTYVQNSNFGIGLPFLSKVDKNLEVRLIESFNFTPQLPAFSLGGDEEALSNINLGAATPKAGGVGGSGGGIGAGGGSIVAGAGIGGVGGTTGVNGGFSGALNNNGAFTTRTTSAFQNLSGIRIDYGISPLIDLRLDYRNRYTKFSDSAFQDSLTHTVRAGVVFNVSPTTQISPSYRLQIFDFQGTGTGSPTTHRAGININHQFTPTLRLQANNAVAFTGGQANYNTQITFLNNYSKGLISFRFTQDISEGSGLAATATLTQNAIAQITRSFGRDFLGFLLFGYGNNRSLSSSAIDLTTYQVRTGVSMAILAWLSGFATYSYVNQESDGTSGNTAFSNQVFIGVTGVSPTWRPFE